MLLSAAPVHADATPTIPATTPDLVALVRGDIEGRRFIGDAGFGVRLRSGALANVFGDTLVTATGNSDYPDAANQPPYVMRNSATVMLPSGRIRSAVPNARLLAGHSLIDVPARDQLPGGRNFYWPTSLTTAVDPVSGKEVILLFLAQMFDPNLAADGRRDVAWTFAQVSSRLAAYSLAPDGRLTLLSLTRTPMPALTRDGIGWGAGTFVTSGCLYVFGSRRPTDVPMAWGSDYYLARVPLASRSTLAAWRFWTGAG